MADAQQKTNFGIPLSSFIFFACIIFITASLGITSQLEHMVHTVGSALSDTDPLWHMAAGDLIRQLGEIPHQDPWGFTTEGYHWLNIAWGWDSLMSFAKEKLGWHGVGALNAITIAITVVAILTHCTLRSQQLFFSIVTLALITPLLVSNLRPLQITHMMTSTWLLLLGCIIRRKLSAGWLALLPVMTIVWVNMHGGFLLAPILIAAFWLQAYLTRDSDMAKSLFVTGIAIGIALFCNPFHIFIIEAAWRPLMTQANSFIIEWQPFSASPRNMLTAIAIIVFITLCRKRPANLLPVEYILIWMWLLFGLSSTRHLSIFALLSAPAIACGLHTLYSRYCVRHANLFNQIAARYNSKSVAKLAIACCIALVLWLPSNHAAQLYGQTKLDIVSLQAETAYITEHHPNARLLTHFDIAAILVYETRGEIPVFIDPRTETAFPAEVIKDYSAFSSAKENWETILDKYKIDGVLILNMDRELLDRFSHRRGWRNAFKGPVATLFIRENHA